MQAIIFHLSGDPVLRQVISRSAPLETLPDRDVYFDLLQSIVSQQLSVKAANTIFQRFLDLFENQKPHPQLLANTDIHLLRGAGLSNQKANYAKNVANFFLAHPSEPWETMDDTLVLEKLTSIKGVGKWTAEMVLMFTLNRPDILPLDDLGIRKTMQQLYKIELEGKALYQKLEAIAEPWRPYRTYACRYLWKWKDSP